MRRCKKFLPYVRRGSKRDKSESISIAFRMAYFQASGRDYWVMLQRGFPHLVIACGRTRREVENSPLLVAGGRKSFRQWARSIQRYVRWGKKS